MALRAAAGHTSSTLWNDVSDDASYLITSEWSDEKAFVDFIQSQAFKDVTTWGKEQILSAARSIRFISTKRVENALQSGEKPDAEGDSPRRREGH